MEPNVITPEVLIPKCELQSGRHVDLLLAKKDHLSVTRENNLCL